MAKKITAHSMNLKHWEAEGFILLCLVNVNHKQSGKYNLALKPQLKRLVKPGHGRKHHI